MQALSRFLSTLLGLALLAALGYGLYRLAQWGGGLFVGIDTQAATLTGLTCAVLLFASRGISSSIRAAAARSSGLTLRQEKTSTYQLFVDYWSNLLRAAPAVEAPLPPAFVDKQLLLERLLALYASAAVIDAHARLRDAERAHGATHARVRECFSAALATVRADLGADDPQGASDRFEHLLLPPLLAASRGDLAASSPVFTASTMVVPGRNA